MKDRKAQRPKGILPKLIGKGHLGGMGSKMAACQKARINPSQHLDTMHFPNLRKDLGSRPAGAGPHKLSRAWVPSFGPPPAPPKTFGVRSLLHRPSLPGPPSRALEPSSPALGPSSTMSGTEFTRTGTEFNYVWNRVRPHWDIVQLCLEPRAPALGHS